MQDATSPPRKRWLQFTLRDCLIASLAIAATIAPLKLHERFSPPARQAMLQARFYAVDADELRELVSGWNGRQLRANSAGEVEKTLAQLARLNAQVVSSPTMLVIADQQARVAFGSSIPIVGSSEDGETSISYKDVGTALSVKPTIQPNGRLRCEMKWQQSRVVAGTETVHKTIPAFNSKGPIQPVAANVLVQPKIVTQEIDLPTELTPGETIFFCDAGDGPDGKGTVVQLHVNWVR